MNQKRLARYEPLLEAVLESPRAMNTELAVRLGKSEATITRAIAELRQLGWLSLSVDTAKIYGANERIRGSIRFNPQAGSPEHGYQGCEEFATYLLGCMSSPAFSRLKKRVFIDAVELTNSAVENVVVIILASQSVDWLLFFKEVEKLPGVIATSSQQLFPVLPINMGNEMNKRAAVPVTAVVPPPSTEGGGL